MMKNTNQNSSSSERDQMFSKLLKPILGILMILLLLIGFIVFLMFRPDFLEQKTEEPETDTVENTSNAQLSALDTANGIDAETGLVASAGLELVKNNCTNCHSSALIIQNRFTREGWHEKIVWMQETQGLWPLGENEDAILDYLAENYAPAPYQGRRAPLDGIEWYELEN